MKETVIKRYQNRKLYDTAASRYVTLEDIAQMVKRNEEVRIVDNRTKKDLTAVTLAQILYEQEKSERSLLPLSTLKNIIANRAEPLVQAMKKGSQAITSGVESVQEKAGEFSRNIEELQNRLEGRLATIRDSVNAARDLKNEIGRLEEKLKKLESRVKELET